jgi:hypothetical protein
MPDPFASPCLPDWVFQPGTNLYTDIVDCDNTAGDWVPQVGNNLYTDVVCCDEEPIEDVIAYGDIYLGDITVEGVAEYLDVPTASGNVPLDQITSDGSTDVGNRATGNPTLAIVVEGYADFTPDSVIATGDVQVVPLTITGTGFAYPYVTAAGDAVLDDIVSEGTAAFIVLVDGFYSGDFVIISEGYAEQEIPTGEGIAPIGDIIVEGDANFALVPTGTGTATLDVVVSGFAEYLNLPTAWGNATLGDILGSVVPSFEVGARVFWTNTTLEIVSEGYALTPFSAEGYISLGEIVSDGSFITRVLAEGTVFLGTIESSGRAYFGPPEQATAREIYEASMVRTMDVKQYPSACKYPVYVPTTDYNIIGTKLRRGTLEYTLTFPFDAALVERIIVWIVDQNGNATKDQIALWQDGPTIPHELSEPFRNAYTIAIPIHCVNNFEYEFFLEIQYKNAFHQGTVDIGAQRFYVPFQAHYDNRSDYINITDSFNTANLTDKRKPYFRYDSFEPVRVDQFFTHEESILISNTEAPTLMAQYDVIGVKELVEYDITRVSILPGTYYFEHKYFELDRGQIGG